VLNQTTTNERKFNWNVVKRSMVLALFYVVAIQPIPPFVAGTGILALNQSTVDGQK
jgi:hypothetical protein